MSVKFRHGSPLMVDHVASGDVAAGDVVVVGDDVRIAHRPIADGELGALAAGGGVYEVPKDTGQSTAIAAGKRVYWNAADSEVTETASTHKIFGRTVAAAGDDDATIMVIHDPGLDNDTTD